ncbi:putative serine/threonine protein kinase [Blattamonas nauphoetae]|uniref:Serine/threonine protein kinase n=1 Tax=Blattamonas nauphoetae TaxID=2049346 RepID=A0ABQ9XSP6_9EUKA|nr:putative serine/threonine protein kinase [Blattamonas nauphoetae]
MSFEDTYSESKPLANSILGKTSIVDRKRDSKQYCVKEIDESQVKDKRAFDDAFRTLRSIASTALFPIVDYRREGGKFYIVTPLATNGTFEKLISEQKESQTPVSEENIWKYLAQIATALKQLEDESMIHGNLKSHNVLFDQDGNVRVADPFLITLLNITPEVLSNRPSSAPEVSDTNLGDITSDLFSVGVILYELMSFEHPYGGEKANAKSPVPKPLPGTYSVELSKLVLSLVSVKPANRPSLAAILKNPKIAPLLVPSGNLTDLCLDLARADNIWDVIGLVEHLADLVPNVDTRERNKAVVQGELVQSLRYLLNKEKEYNSAIAACVGTIVFHLARVLPFHASYFATPEPQPKTQPAPSMLDLLVRVVTTSSNTNDIPLITAQAISKIVSVCPPELRVTLFEEKNLGEALLRLTLHSADEVREKASEALLSIAMSGVETEPKDDAPNRLKAKYDSYETAQSSLLKLVEKAPAVAPNPKEKKEPTKEEDIQVDIALNAAAALAIFHKGSSLPEELYPILPHLTLAVATQNKTPTNAIPAKMAFRSLALQEGKKFAAAIHTQEPVTALDKLPLPCTLLQNKLVSFKPSKDAKLAALRSTLEWLEMLLKFASDDTEAALSLETDLFADLQTLFKQTNAKSGDPVQADPSDPVARLCCAIIHDLCDGNALAVDIIDKLIASNLHTTLITTIAKTGAAVTSSMLEALHSFSFGRASQMKTLIDAGVVDVLVDALDAKDPNAADTACVTLSAFVALSGEDPATFREKKRDDKVYKTFVKHQQAFEKTWFSSQLHQYQEHVERGHEHIRHGSPDEAPLAPKEYVFVKGKHDMCALHSAVCLAMMYKGSELPLTYQAILLYLYPVALAIPHSPHGGNARYALAVLAEGKGEENLKKSIVSSTYAASLPSLILANEALRTLSKDAKLAIADEGFFGRMFQYLSQLLKTKSLGKNTKAVKATLPALETERTWVCLVMSVAHKVLVDCNHSTEELFYSNLPVPVVALLQELKVDNTEHSDLIRIGTSLLFEICTECELDEELETLADLGAVKAATPFLLHSSPDVSTNCAFVISRVVAGQWRLLQDSCAVGCEHEHEPASHPCFAEMETTKLDDTLFALFERLIGDRKKQERCRHKRRHPPPPEEMEDEVALDRDPLPGYVQAFDRDSIQKAVDDQFNTDDDNQLIEIERLVSANRTLLSCATALCYLYTAKALPERFHPIIPLLTRAAAAPVVGVAGRALVAILSLVNTPANEEPVLQNHFAKSVVALIGRVGKEEDTASIQTLNAALSCLSTLLTSENEETVKAVKADVTADTISPLSSHSDESVQNSAEIVVELLSYLDQEEENIQARLKELSSEKESISLSFVFIPLVYGEPESGLSDKFREDTKFYYLLLSVHANEEMHLQSSQLDTLATGLLTLLPVDSKEWAATFKAEDVVIASLTLGLIKSFYHLSNLQDITMQFCLDVISNICQRTSHKTEESELAATIPHSTLLLYFALTLLSSLPTETSMDVPELSEIIYHLCLLSIGQFTTENAFLSTAEFPPNIISSLLVSTLPLFKDNPRVSLMAALFKTKTDESIRLRSATTSVSFSDINEEWVRNEIRQMAAELIWVFSGHIPFDQIFPKSSQNIQILPRLFTLFTSSSLSSPQLSATLNHILIAFSYYSRHASCKTLMREEEGLQSLLRLLTRTSSSKAPSIDIIQNSIRILWNCASEDENKVVIVNEGGVDFILSVLAMPTLDEATAQLASGALYILSQHPLCQDAIEQANGIPILCHHLHAQNVSITRHTTGILANTAQRASCCMTMVDSGGFETVLSILRNSLSEPITLPSSHVPYGQSAPLAAEIIDPHCVHNVLAILSHAVQHEPLRLYLHQLNVFSALVPFLLFRPLDQSRVSSLELLAENEQQELEALNLALSTISVTTLSPATRDLPSDSSVIPRLVSLVAWCTLFVEAPSQIVSPILHPLLHSLTALTHFSTVNVNKIMIVKSDGLPTLVRLLSRPPILSLPPLIPQNALTTLWNCARNEEIKDISRSVGVIDTLLALLDASIRSEVDLQTIETTLGALLSLTVNAENKSYVREHNGLPLLVSCLARFQITPHTPQHIPVLHTALTTLRNCCSNATNAVLFVQLGGCEYLFKCLSPHAPPSVTKEAVLLVKNLTLVDQNKKEIVLQQLHKPILELSLTSQNADVGRVANDIIRSLSSHPESRQLLSQDF